MIMSEITSSLTFKKHVIYILRTFLNQQSTNYTDQSAGVVCETIINASIAGHQCNVSLIMVDDYKNCISDIKVITF